MPKTLGKIGKTLGKEVPEGPHSGNSTRDRLVGIKTVSRVLHSGNKTFPSANVYTRERQNTREKICLNGLFYRNGNFYRVWTLGKVVNETLGKITVPDVSPSVWQTITAASC